MDDLFLSLCVSAGRNGGRLAKVGSIFLFCSFLGGRTWFISASDGRNVSSDWSRMDILTVEIWYPLPFFASKVPPFNYHLSFLLIGKRYHLDSTLAGREIFFLYMDGQFIAASYATYAMYSMFIPHYLLFFDFLRTTYDDT